ncbi:MAG: sigma-E processing peptidase SpoIIGA [Oscillospiraceae bacterium]|nr:sigma-E processing peptidase SpoIIGA [Oscillospiraceae bacterium]
MRVIYVDVLFFINTIINYLMLLATAKVCAVAASRLRIAGAAALGGLFAVISALPSLEFLRNPLAIIAIGVLMITIAFGGEHRLVRLGLVFLAVSAGAAGFVLGISLLGGGGAFAGGVLPPIRFRTLIVSFAVCYAVVTLVFRRVAGNKGGIVPLTVRQGKSVLELKALVDTGNTLVDPMTGMSVIVTGVLEAKKLFPKEVRLAIEEIGRRGAISVMEELATRPCPLKFRLIPYSAVGVVDGVLLSFKPDEIVVDGEARRGILVAISPNSVSDNGTYSALIGA